MSFIIIYKDIGSAVPLYWTGRKRYWSQSEGDAHRYWSHEAAWRALRRGRAQEQNPYNEYKFKHSVVKSIKEAT